MQERFGNFTLIVTDEGIIAVVNRLRDFRWALRTGSIVALCSVALAVIMN